MSSGAHWSCRPYRPGDEVHLAALFERVFERPMTPDRWIWKLGRWRGSVPNVWIAVDQHDRPICHYGGIPRRLRRGGQERTIMVVADAMTAPGFRRQGAYTAVVTRAHRAWRDAGVALVLGLPNERHGSRIGALGWQRLCPLRWMIRPLRLDRLLQRRSRLGRLPGVGRAARLWNTYWEGDPAPPGIALDAANEEGAGAAFAQLARPAGAHNRLVLARDREWMAHRLLHAPGEKHEILVATDERGARGYCAYRVHQADGRRFGAIPEIVADDARIGSALVGEAVRRMRAAGAETAIALAVPRGCEHRILRSHGFLFSWGAFEVQTVILDPLIRIDELRGADRWMLSGGDFDVI